MRSFVLDASALLRFLHNEAGSARVEQLLMEAQQGQAELSMSAVNWGEVIYIISRESGVREAQSIIAAIKSMPLKIESVGSDSAEAAALFKQRWKVPYADAFAGVLGESSGATLVTADNDFRLVHSGLTVEFLPSTP
jgi:predicted nucleic acid-binding protein